MYKKIMVPLDGSKLAECVLSHVETVVKGCSVSEVILVQAVEPITIPYGREMAEVTSLEKLKELEIHNKADAEKYLRKIAARLKKIDINVKTIVLYGKASDALADYVDKNWIDLLIIATHGRSGVSRWVMGSVADRLMRSVSVPVLMVRAPGCAA